MSLRTPALWADPRFRHVLEWFCPAHRKRPASGHETMAQLYANPQPQTPRISAVSSSVGHSDATGLQNSTCDSPSNVREPSARSWSHRGSGLFHLLSRRGFVASHRDNSDPCFARSESPGRNCRTGERAGSGHAGPIGRTTPAICVAGLPIPPNRVWLRPNRRLSPQAVSRNKGGGHVANRPRQPPPSRAPQTPARPRPCPMPRPQWTSAANLPAPISGTWPRTSKPKASGFALISSAYASDMPMSSCEADKPRNYRQVLSMADDKFSRAMPPRSTCPAITIASGPIPSTATW